MKYTPLFILFIFLTMCEAPAHDPFDQLNLSDKLSGKWKADAFDGILSETWTLGKDGWMSQEGFYIEDQDTSYSAKTKIEIVGNDTVLFSVIKDSNPKIFKAFIQTKNTITFKNDDYKSPFKVHYEFISDSKYSRTITGYEGDSLVVYKFDFSKE